MASKVLPTPVKSVTDEKKYRVIELPNGLRALLISDKRFCLTELDEEERVLDVSMNGDDEKMDEDDESGDGSSEGDDEEDGEEDEGGEVTHFPYYRIIIKRPLK